MATLEVHDSQGRVQFVELSRDHPVLFGTSSACDVLLEGEFIRPVHGRIRWKSRKIQGRGLARRRVRADQRPQDDDQQHSPGRRDHGGRLPDVPDPRRGRLGRPQAIEVAGRR